MTEEKKKALDAAFAEFAKDPAKVGETVSTALAAAQRDKDRLFAYGVANSELRFLAKWISGSSFEVPEADVQKVMLAVLFAARLVELLEQRFDPSVRN